MAEGVRHLEEALVLRLLGLHKVATESAVLVLDQTLGVFIAIRLLLVIRVLVGNRAAVVIGPRDLLLVLSLDRPIKIPLRLQLVSEHDALSAADRKLGNALLHQLEKTLVANLEPLLTAATISHEAKGDGRRYEASRASRTKIGFEKN